jgi:hypothetical protein
VRDNADLVSVEVLLYESRYEADGQRATSARVRSASCLRQESACGPAPGGLQVDVDTAMDADIFGVLPSATQHAWE